jgi:hypothetical protein
MARFHDTYREMFGEDYKKESYKLIPHSMVFNKRIGKQVCSNCGLVGLRNVFTDWSIRIGCLASEHSSYQNMRKSTGID